MWMSARFIMVDVRVYVLTLRAATPVPVILEPHLGQIKNSVWVSQVPDVSVCGTLKCEQVARREEIAKANVKIDVTKCDNMWQNNSKCEMFYTFREPHFFLHIYSYFAHTSIASIVTFSVDMSSHIVAFSHIEVVSHIRMPHVHFILSTVLLYYSQVYYIDILYLLCCV